MHCRARGVARNRETQAPPDVTPARPLHPIDQNQPITHMKSLRLVSYLASGALTLAFAGPEKKVTDPQIAAIVVAANQVDIDAGKFAAKKSSHAEVKKFAETMVTDHTAVNKSAVELVKKLNVSPEDNDTSRALRAGGEKNLTALRTLKGKDFDRAYVAHEVAYHEQVLQALDTVLIPNAQNAELKALLIKVRPAFVEHLNHAKHLESILR
jgi:putative membrane protein